MLVIEFDNGGNVGQKRKAPRFLGLSKWKNHIQSFRDESEFRKSMFIVEGPINMLTNRLVL